MHNWPVARNCSWGGGGGGGGGYYTDKNAPKFELFAKLVDSLVKKVETKPPLAPGS